MPRGLSTSRRSSPVAVAPAAGRPDTWTQGHSCVPCSPAGRAFCVTVPVRRRVPRPAFQSRDLRVGPWRGIKRVHFPRQVPVGVARLRDLVGLGLFTLRGLHRIARQRESTFGQRPHTGVVLFVHLLALHRFLLVALDILCPAVRDVEIQPADRGGGLLPAAAEDQVQAQHERQAQ